MGQIYKSGGETRSVSRRSGLLSSFTDSLWVIGMSKIELEVHCNAPLRPQSTQALCKATYHYVDHRSIVVESVPPGAVASVILKLRNDFSDLRSLFQEFFALFRGKGSTRPGKKYGESILNSEWQWATPEGMNFHQQVFSAQAVFEVGHWPARPKFLLLCFFLN